MADGAAASLRTLRDDALTMLVLWATTQEYSADIEALLKQWASTFDVPDDALLQRLNDATSGALQRPPDARTGLHEGLDLSGGAPETPTAGGDGGQFAGAAAGSKRTAPGASAGTGGASEPAAKRYKVLPVLEPGNRPFANIGPAIGRKVLRYWPKDAARNRGDPWFPAVVTDYEELSGAHILTYQFGTPREEKERVSLSLKTADELQLTDEVIDLVEWYADPKRRRRSSAVEKSAHVRRQYAALHGITPGSTPGSGARSKGGKAGHGGSNSALSSGCTL